MHTTGQLKSTNALIQSATRSILFVGMAVLLGSGCASTRSKFKSHEKVDLMPFAEQTIAILSSTEYPLAQDNSVLIREFLGDETPGVLELDAALEEADGITESMQIYSIELMKISRLQGEDDVRVKAVAEVVRTVEAPIRKKLDLTDALFEEKLAEIAAKPDFLAAIRAVQPLIDSAGVYYSSVLDSAESYAAAAALSVDAAIDTKYAALLEFRKVLDSRKQAVLEGLAFVHHYRRGDKTALQALPVLLAQGESGVALTMGLTSQLLRIGVVVEDGPSALEQALPPHQKWLARKYGGQANQWAGSEIAAAILGLRRLDRLLKSSPLPDEHHLAEWLLVQMARSAAA